MLPVTESFEVKNIQSGSSEIVNFSYYAFAIKSTNPSSEYYSVSFELIPTNSAAPLQSTINRIHFLQGETIDPKKSLYRDEVGGNWLTLSLFDQSRLIVGAEWRYFDVGANAPKTTLYHNARSLTEVYVGYRFPDDDGTHFGWLRFARNNISFTNVFDLVAHDWNPIPEAPIRAGLPPEIPLATEVVDDGTGGSFLRIGWNPALASWAFETTGDLTPPITWSEYPAGGTSAEIPLDAADSQRYFRLRRP